MAAFHVIWTVSQLVSLFFGATDKSIWYQPMIPGTRFSSLFCIPPNEEGMEEVAGKGEGADMLDGNMPAEEEGEEGDINGMGFKAERVSKMDGDGALPLESLLGWPPKEGKIEPKAWPCLGAAHSIIEAMR